MCALFVATKATAHRTLWSTLGNATSRRCSTPWDFASFFSSHRPEQTFPEPSQSTTCTAIFATKSIPLDGLLSISCDAIKDNFSRAISVLRQLPKSLSYASSVTLVNQTDQLCSVTSSKSTSSSNCWPSVGRRWTGGWPATLALSRPATKMR